MRGENPRIPSGPELPGGPPHPVPPSRWGEGDNCGWGVKRLEGVLAMGAGKSEARPLIPHLSYIHPAPGTPKRKTCIRFNV